MTTPPNTILRGGQADGRTTYVEAPGEPVAFEDVGGGQITYVDTGEVETRDGVELRVYAPKH